MNMLLAQCASAVGDPGKNLQKLKAIFENTDAEITVFPELFVSGYVPRDDLPALAEEIDGPIVSKLSSMCRDAGRSLIAGIPLKHPSIKGQITNSAVAIDERGGVGRYDKTYLPTFGPFEENLYFTPGSAATVKELSGLRVGVVICYDLFFPELPKLLALQGADLIVCASASPTATVVNFKKMMPARALENATYMAYVNLVGTHLDLVFGGESRLVDPRGEIVVEAKPLAEDLVTGEIDISKLEFARRMRPTLRDSRKEVFEAIIDLKKFA
jgi:predicted amidohydrolase